MAHTGGPPAGWFPDPGGSNGLRWWDGSQWTQHTAMPRPGYGAIDPERALRDERTIARWARPAIIVYALVIVVGGYFAVQIFDTLDEQVAAAVAAAEAGAPPPSSTEMYPFDGTALAISQLVNGLQLGAFIVLLIWVYRAASAAAALGIPARRGPGWAVGSWFIPVVNLWFPVQSLRDLLPPEHPTRRTILILWLVSIAAYVVALIAMMGAAFGEGSIVLAIVGFVVVAGTLIVGRQVIDDVLECHESIAAERRGAAGAQVRW